MKVSDTDKTKTMTDEKVQEDKPAVTFKDENSAALADKTEPKTDEKYKRTNQPLQQNSVMI